MPTCRDRLASAACAQPRELRCGRERRGRRLARHDRGNRIGRDHRLRERVGEPVLACFAVPVRQPQPQRTTRLLGPVGQTRDRFVASVPVRQPFHVEVAQPVGRVVRAVALCENVECDELREREYLAEAAEGAPTIGGARARRRSSAMYESRSVASRLRRGRRAAGERPSPPRASALERGCAGWCAT